MLNFFSKIIENFIQCDDIPNSIPGTSYIIQDFERLDEPNNTTRQISGDNGCHNPNPAARFLKCNEGYINEYGYCWGRCPEGYSTNDAFCSKEATRCCRRDPGISNEGEICNGVTCKPCNLGLSPEQLQQY